ncbi:hypothetical protein GZL_04807 [Streptomyces sp. 769]|nr:hypothetical protein GZL_04807 [Streptomyces sp. 769]
MRRLHDASHGPLRHTGGTRSTDPPHPFAPAGTGITSRRLDAHH